MRIALYVLAGIGLAFTVAGGLGLFLGAVIHRVNRDGEISGADWAKWEQEIDR